MAWPDPVLLEIGVLEIRYYGIAYLLGFLLGWWLLRREAESGRIARFTPERVDTLITFVLIGLLAGARIFTFLVYEPAQLLEDPLELFRIWRGGMSFHGGLIGAVVGGIWFSRRYNVSWRALADLLVLPAALGLALGRITNFINGELVGTLTNVPWCVDFSTNPHARAPLEGCRHPSQLYEAAKNLLIFTTLVPLYHLRRYREGFIFWLFLLLYGVLRTAVTVLRDDPRIIGLSIGQWLSLTMAIIAAIVLWRGRPWQHPDTKVYKSS